MTKGKAQNCQGKELKIQRPCKPAGCDRHELLHKEISLKASKASHLEVGFGW